MVPPVFNPPGRFASRFEPYLGLIQAMRARGATYAEITTELLVRHNLRVSISWLCQLSRLPPGGRAPLDPVRALVIRRRNAGQSYARIVAALQSEDGVTTSREAAYALTRGNPYQSKLAPHGELIFRLWRKRRTYAQIAAELAARHGVRASLATIYSFIKVRLPRICPLSAAGRRDHVFTDTPLRSSTGPAVCRTVPANTARRSPARPNRGSAPRA